MGHLFEKKGESPKDRNDKKGRLNGWYLFLWLLSLALFFIFLIIYGQNGLFQVGELKQVKMELIEEISVFERIIYVRMIVKPLPVIACDYKQCVLPAGH